MTEKALDQDAAELARSVKAADAHCSKTWKRSRGSNKSSSYRRRSRS